MLYLNINFISILHSKLSIINNNIIMNPFIIKLFKYGRN